jgi:hypothetical protein
MAKAGYDPRALAHMFETIGKEAEASGGGTPQWMSSHPNPGNRTVYINQEAERLQITNPVDGSEFAKMKPVFASLPPAKSMGELAKAGAGGGGSGNGEELAAVGTPGQPVPAPASQYREIAGGKVFKASVPSNWTVLPAKTSIKAVPENGYGPLNGQTVFSHGVEFGVTKASSRDLAEATKTWLQAVAQSNPELKLGGDQQAIKISQRSAIATPLVNSSPLGGQERIVVCTTFLVEGTMFYYLTVVQEKDAQNFQATFRRIGESIQLTDAR